MSKQDEHENQFQFQKPGNIARPGLIGRLARLFFAAVHFYFFGILVTEGEWLLSTSIPSHPGWWIGIAWALYVFPRVINIGFAVRWRTKPRLAVISILVVGFVYSLLRYGTAWGPELGWFMLIWLIYVYAHLGLSFLLSAIVGSPGCEMRAIPFIWTMLTGRETHEHHCPGVLGRIDQWELRKEG